MNFLLFMLYYFICSIILGLVLLCIYRFYVKRKCEIVSRTAEKAIDDYFKAYDSDFPVDFDTLRNYKNIVGDNNVDNINR